MVANHNNTRSMNPNGFKPNVNAAAVGSYFVDEGIRPFAKPVVQRASNVLKAVQYPTLNHAVPKKVLQTDNGHLYEEGIEIKDARFGKVHRIYRLQPCPDRSDVFIRSDEKLAVKKLHKRAILYNREKAENPLHEIAALQLLAAVSPDQIPYVDCFADTEIIYLITPFYHNGDLLDLIFQKQTLQQQFTLKEVKGMFQQLVEQLNLIHRMGIAHRDLSLENILFDSESGKFTVIDYGMSVWLKALEAETVHHSHDSDMMITTEEEEEEESQSFSSSSTNSVLSSTSSSLYDRFAKLSHYFTCGKTHYMAPEIWEKQRDVSLMYSDIWSLGVIFFMVMMFQAPFASARESDGNYHFYLSSDLNLRELIRQFHASPGGETGAGLIWNQSSREENEEYDSLVDLITRMLHPTPSQRYTIEDVMNHPFFSS